MLQEFFTGQFSTALQLRIFKQVLKCCLLLCLLIYGSTRIIFFDMPFDWMEELNLIAKIMLTATLFALGISSLLLAADAIQYFAGKKGPGQPVFLVKSAAILLLLIIVITACKAQTNITGTIKDKGTGLTALYKNIKPGKYYWL